MLSKSVSNLQQIESLGLLVDKKESCGAGVIFAYIEALQSYKQHGRVAPYVERLFTREPDNKQVQAMYLEYVGKKDLQKAIQVQ